MTKKEQENSINIETDAMSKLFLMLDRMNATLLSTQEMLKQQNDKIISLSKNVDGLKERIMMIDGNLDYLEKHLDKKMTSFQEKNTQHQKLIEENLKAFSEMVIKNSFTSNKPLVNVDKNLSLNNKDVEKDSQNQEKSIDNIIANIENFKQIDKKSNFVLNLLESKNLNKENIKSTSSSSWWKKTDPENKNILDLLKKEREEEVQKFFSKYTEEKITNDLKNTYAFKTIKQFVFNIIENTKALNLSKTNAHLFFENNQFERLCFQIKGFRNKEDVSILLIFHPFEKKLLKDVEFHYSINGVKQNRFFDLYIPHENWITLSKEMKVFIETHAF